MTTPVPPVRRRALAAALGVVLAGVVTVAGLLVVSSPALAANSGPVTGNGGKCLDVTGGASTNGTPVQLWRCTSTASQQWTASWDGTLRAEGKCLDVYGGNTYNGAPVQIYDCNGSGAQRWTAAAGHQLVNPQSGRCLDAVNGATADGTRLQLWDCNGTQAQQWALPEHSLTVASPGYEITFQDGDSRQWNVDPNGVAYRTWSALAPNTSPSVVGLRDGSHEEAFVASDNTLWIGNSRTGGQQFKPCNSSYYLAPGASPVIVAGAGGGWLMSWTYGTDDLRIGATDSSELPGTCSHDESDASLGTGSDIAALPSGGYLTTWVGPDGHVQYRGVDHNTYTVTAFTVRPGTRPAMAINKNGVGHIAAQAADSREWDIDVASGNAVQTLSSMAPNSSPDIVALPDGTFEKVIVASDNTLWVENTTTGGHGTGRTVAAGTSPAIAVNAAGGWEIAWHGTDDHLSTLDSANKSTTLNVYMRPGTGPGIGALIGTAATPTTTSPTTSGPRTVTLTLDRQPVSSGYIPFTGKFPALGSVPPSHLISIRYPASGFLDTAVLFVRFGHSSAECGDPNAIVQLNEGATTTTAQLTAIYGTAQPHFDTLHPLVALACYAGSPLPLYVNVELTIQNN